MSPCRRRVTEKTFDRFQQTKSQSFAKTTEPQRVLTTIDNAQRDLHSTTTLVTTARSSKTIEQQSLLTKNENSLLRNIELITHLFYPSATVSRTIRSDEYNIQRMPCQDYELLTFCQTRFNDALPSGQMSNASTIA
jgi:hypothetical protein